MRNALRRPHALLLALLLTVVVVGVAYAHANLVKSEPAPGAVLGNAPAQVRLWYDSEVDVHFSDVQVLDKNLTRVDNNDLKAVAGDPKELVITLKPLSDGTYTVAWKAFSAVDGHITRGNFAFSVGTVTGPVIAPAVPATGSVGETDPLSIAVRWLTLLALLALAGALFFRVLLLERSLRAAPLPAPAEAAALGIWKQLAFTALMLALVTTAASLLIEASVVGGVPLANLLSSDAVSRTLLQTHFGILWSARMILLLALGATLFVRWKWARFVAVALGLGTLLTVSEGGHSAAVGGEVSLALVSDWLHLTGVSIWVGGLFSLFAVMLALWGRVTAEKRAQWIAWMVPQFSAIALPTTLVIALTGLYDSLLQIPTLNSLLTTQYGDTLTLKVALFLVMVGFGAMNLLLLSPRFRHAVSTPERASKVFSRFRLTVGAEVALGASAIFLAGLLTLEPPARASIEQPSAPSFASNPAAPQSAVLVDDAAPDVQVTLTLTPTVDNPTTFDVYLTNPQTAAGTPTPATPNGPVSTGAPITNVLRLIVQFTLLDQDQGITTQIAQPQGNGHYSVSGQQLTLPGMWKVHVIVRRAGVDDVAVDFPLYKPVARGPVTTSDPQAAALLQASEATMNQLQSLRSQQDLNDGSNGVVITDYQYHAPDAMRFDVRGEAASIAIGGVQYYQDQNGNWTERPRVDPFVFPQFNASTQAIDVQLGRLDSLNGEEAQIVRYVIPDASSNGGTEFAQWISTTDHRLLQLAMVAPSHFMIQYYMDYNSPQIAVAAPPNVAATPAPAAAPASVSAPVNTRPKGPITGDLEADVALVVLAGGVVVGVVATGRRRARRQRLALLAVSAVAILGAISLAVDAFNGIAALAANAPINLTQAASGQTIYNTECAACHGPTGHGDGPAGKNLPVKPFDLTTHVLLHDEQYLDAVITNGRGYMPTFKNTLTQDQIFAVIAYTRLLARQAQQGGGVPGFTPQP